MTRPWPHPEQRADFVGEDLTEISGVPDFWDRVRSAPHRLLALDYDGTLAPFRVQREWATPLDGVREALQDLCEARDTSLAILSGRNAREVRNLIGRELPIPIFGAHGYEQLHADGRIECSPLEPLQEQGLAKAVSQAAEAGFAEWLEKKSGSVALHTRARESAHGLKERLLTLWAPQTDDHHLLVRRFDGGLELYAPGRNKGTALADLYAGMPPGTLTVYIGDDTTDEDAFRYVKPHGIGIKVGLAGTTAASGRVPDPGVVLAILRCWQRMMAAAG